MIGCRFRLKDGDVVTVKSVSGKNFLALTAEGNTRYFSSNDVCHQLGTVCDKVYCWDIKQEAARDKEENQD